MIKKTNKVLLENILKYVLRKLSKNELSIHHIYGIKYSPPQIIKSCRSLFFKSIYLFKTAITRTQKNNETRYHVPPGEPSTLFSNCDLIISPQFTKRTENKSTAIDNSEYHPPHTKARRPYLWVTAHKLTLFDAASCLIPRNIPDAIKKNGTAASAKIVVKYLLTVQSGCKNKFV